TKGGRPKGSVSVFKSMPWVDQMNAIRRYLEFGVYPDCILDTSNNFEKKSRKKQFRTMCMGYKIINGQLQQLKVRRKYKDMCSERKYKI
ncbi:MAG: hypothetical protein MJE68_32805, partial [Proteobacteria bacterium]|nr:hypothetical protein [Pseudomonadota bacterium]